MPDPEIYYKRIEPVQVAYIKTRVAGRDEILPLFDRLRSACGPLICGKALAVFHGGAVQEGMIVEAAYPVSSPVETGDIHTRTLEEVPALITFHYGPHQNMRETVLALYEYHRSHAWTSSLIRREIYHIFNSAEPEKNVTEVQFLLHEWDRLLAEGAERVLGSNASRYIMQGIERINPESSFEDYSAWIRSAIDRLDNLTGSHEEKCRVVSNCAHVFPQERIEHLRAIYALGEFDAVLREMYRDDFWYEKPVRRENVIYMQKNPFDEEEYKKAEAPLERRKAYCHCPFVKPYLERDGRPGTQKNGSSAPMLSPTFCYCGAGWYRRLWEGIIGQPVKIECQESLLRGDNRCTFTITLPLSLEGECNPKGKNRIHA